MKIVKAKIEGFYLIPPTNEPYKNKKLVITKITHYYNDGGFDVSLNTMFGFEADDDFYKFLDLDCVVELNITNKIDKDLYYEANDFKNACFNKTENNPYQLPN